jgi:spermidine synthase
MLPWTLLDTAKIPGETDEMRLLQRGDEYSIRVGRCELMNSRVHGSEDALASLVCTRIADRPRARVLIGGLGMGFTLMEVLQRVRSDSEVVISELVPEVVAWHRGPLRVVSGATLDDPRVTIEEQDVVRVIREDRKRFDAILLDVDNGPRALTTETNSWLYSPAGLRGIIASLRPRGILAIWSSGPDAAFVRRLQQTGFEVEQVAARSKGNKGPRYIIWIAQLPE